MAQRTVLIAGLALLSGMATALRADSPENLALNKPYTLSVAPNYAHCTDLDDKTQLTDGIHAEGYFWTQKETVGWHGVAPLLVTIDLGRTEPIAGVSWSTAAGVAGVTWPERLFVLVSDDAQTWTYLGNLRELGIVDGLPPAGQYANYRFATSRLKGRGRYVCLMAAATPFCFVDEIEVWRGPDEWLTAAAADLPGQRTDNLAAFYRASCVKAGIAVRLTDDLQTILTQALDTGQPQLASNLRSQAEPLAARITAEAQNADPNVPSILPYAGLHREILALNSPVLRASGISAPRLWRANRWDPLALTVIPPTDAAADPITLDLMRGEVRGETLNITNPGDSPLPLTLSLAGLPETARVELREVLFTDTPSQTPVAAALRPLVPGAEGARIEVPAGTTTQIWISSHRPQAEAGTYQGTLRLAAPDGSFSENLELTVRIRNLDFPAQPSLHVGGWDYVQGDATYYKAPGNLESNLALMRDMYVDSPWATPAVFPQGAQFDAEGHLLNADQLDFTTWNQWIDRWSGARNYCVFFSVGTSFNGEPMGTSRFNTMVTQWLAAWVSHLEGQGLQARQFVILLFDEPYQPEHDATIVAWATPIREANLGVTLFVDPTYRDPTQGDPAMYAANDILCPNTPMLISEGPRFRDFYLRQKQAGKTLWLYSCSGPAKQLDPITYHRVQPWIAFQLGAEGSFYWAFGCGGGIGDSWHAYAQAHNEYSPYFVGPDSVMEGKHSEALREGVQDYEYLRMLRDRLAQARAADAQTPTDPAWIARAEALLSEGVAQAVAVATPKNASWDVPKDRSLMDSIRVSVLDALEAANPLQPIEANP